MGVPFTLKNNNYNITGCYIFRVLHSHAHYMLEPLSALLSLHGVSQRLTYGSNLIHVI